MIKPKHPPYEGTSVPADRTLQEIQKLLLDYGCDAVQVQREATGRVLIRFGIEVETNGIKRRIGVEVEPPLLTKKRKTEGRYNWERKIVQEPDVDRSMRCAYWYIKTKLEAVATGLASAEQEFLAQVMIQLPSGATSTVGRSVDESIQKGGGIYLPGLEQRRPALPSGGS